MSKGKIVGSVIIITLIILAWAFKVKPKEPMEYYRPYVINELEQSIQWLQEIRKNKTNPDQMKKAYHESRKHYKHIECFVEYCSPKAAKFGVNGPLVLKNDPEYGSRVFYPKGYQTIEESLFSGEPLDTNILNQQVNEL